MAADLSLRLAGEQMLLCGERALYWPRQRWLLLADLHLGKGDAFRRAGIALPRGGTGHDLARHQAHAGPGIAIPARIEMQVLRHIGGQRQAEHDRDGVQFAVADHADRLRSDWLVR